MKKIASAIYLIFLATILALPFKIGAAAMPAVCNITATAKISGAALDIAWKTSYTPKSGEEIALLSKPVDSSWISTPLTSSPYTAPLPAGKISYQVVVFNSPLDQNTCASAYSTYDPATGKITTSTTDPTTNGKTPTPTPTPTDKSSPENAAGSILPANPETWNLETITIIINNILTWVSVTAGALATFLIIYGAFNYFVAFGSEEKVTDAKRTILFTLVGLGLIILAKIAVALIVNFFQNGG